LSRTTTTSALAVLTVVAEAIRSEANPGAPPVSEPQSNQVPHMQMTQSARRRPMKGKTAVKTALLFALSLPPMWVMADGDVKTLPLPQKQACADSETSVWCAPASDKSGVVEVRHPLAQAMNRDGGRDYLYKTKTLEGCDLCFDN
jgi:hypothetical protein